MADSVDLGSGKPQSLRTHCPPPLSPPSGRMQPNTHNPMSVSFLLWLKGRRQADRRWTWLCSSLPVWIPRSSLPSPPLPPPPLDTSSALPLLSLKVVSLSLWLGQLHVPSSCHLIISHTSVLWLCQLGRGSLSRGRLWLFPTSPVSHFSCKGEKAAEGSPPSSVTAMNSPNAGLPPVSRPAHLPLPDLDAHVHTLLTLRTQNTLHLLSLLSSLCNPSVSFPCVPFCAPGTRTGSFRLLLAPLGPACFPESLSVVCV